MNIKEELCIVNVKPTSKKALEQLTEKEKILKDELLNRANVMNMEDKEILRVCAWVIQAIKKARKH